jgi:hypothetical protein
LYGVFMLLSSSFCLPVQVRIFAITFRRESATYY